MIPGSTDFQVTQRRGVREESAVVVCPADRRVTASADAEEKSNSAKPMGGGRGRGCIEKIEEEEEEEEEEGEEDEWARDVKAPIFGEKL